MQLNENAGWWMGDDDSHGVEISIAGGVGEMARDPTPRRFFFSFFFISCTLFYISSRYKDYRQSELW